MSGSNVKDFLEELKEQAKSAGSRDDEEGATYLDPSDGTICQFDAEKSGWFPKMAANLTKQDSKRMKALEEELEEKDKQIAALQMSITELEKTNRQLKDEQERLRLLFKTVNELRLDNINRLNTDSQQQLSTLRHKLAESSQARREKDEAKIIEMQIDKNSLEEPVVRLELRKQLKQAQQNSSSATPGTRISEARSGYSSRADSAALGTGRYSSFSTNDSRSYGLSSPIAQRGKDEAKIIELQIDKNSLEERVARLDQENTQLRKQLKQAQQNSSTVTRISKARSEPDLSRKFDKYATYDKQKYKELEPVAKAIGYSSRTDSTALGTGRYSSFSTNDSRSYGLSSPIDMNGCSSANRRTLLSDSVTREPVTARVMVPRHRRGSLGEGSDVSDDLEHAPYSRWRSVQTSEPSSSSVVNGDPVSSLYRSHDRGMGRRTRPHSYGGGSVRDLYRSKDDRPSPAQQIKISSYSQRPVDRHTSSPHFSSTDSSPLTSTAHQPSPDKVVTKPFVPTSSDDIQLGMEVLVTRSRGQIARGKVKFVGQLPGKDETYVGLELGPCQEGKNDGTWNGHRFFRCKPNRGIFVSLRKVVMCYGGVSVGCYGRMCDK